MSAVISYTSYDYKPITIVPVIASFDTDGHIAPLYVRINGESYKVDSFWTSCKFANSIEFHCKLIDHDIRKPLLLTYYKAEDIWAIPRAEKSEAP